ncbi:hypothetical protein VKT23_010661 [Stygiomarasmius scandens]|uniref:Uncharacterized protein n=1 Tax=Marasmiellus scandens TaxID=2682957 RepID=A0ABR1JDK3_9AGAR
MPDLWAHIWLDIDTIEENSRKGGTTYTDRAAYVLQSVLSRSKPKHRAKGEPLELFFTRVYTKNIPDWGFEYLEILMEECDRWDHLYVNIADLGCFPDLQSISDELVSLKHLSINVEEERSRIYEDDDSDWRYNRGEPSHVVDEFLLELGYLPCLTSLCLSHLSKSLISELPQWFWDNIREISVNEPLVETVNNVLLSAKRLQSMTITSTDLFGEEGVSFWGLARPKSNEDRIQHEALTHLFFTHADWLGILDFLLLPNLLDIQFGETYTLHHSHILSLVKFLRRSCPPLRTLKIAHLRPGQPIHDDRRNRLHDHPKRNDPDYLLVHDQLLLSSLRTLCWDNSTPEFASLFDILTLPSLSNLEVVNCVSSQSLDQILSMIKRSSCSLRTLRLQYCGLADRTLEGILQASPYLEHLELEGAIYDHLLTKMTTPSAIELEYPLLLPRLKSFKVMNARQVFNPEALIGMLQSYSNSNLKEALLEFKGPFKKPVLEKLEEMIVEKGLFSASIFTLNKEDEVESAPGSATSIWCKKVLDGPSCAPRLTISHGRTSIRGEKHTEDFYIIGDVAEVVSQSLDIQQSFSLSEHFGGQPDENLSA